MTSLEVHSIHYGPDLTSHSRLHMNVNVTWNNSNNEHRTYVIENNFTDSHCKSRRQPLRLINLFCFNKFSRKWWLIIIAIVKYNLLTILKLQHDILRPCYRPIIKVQNPNLRIFSLYHPVSLPLSVPPWVVCDKTIIEWFLSIHWKIFCLNLQYQPRGLRPLGWHCKFSQNIFQCILRNYSIIV